MANPTPPTRAPQFVFVEAQEAFQRASNKLTEINHEHLAAELARDAAGDALPDCSIEQVTGQEGYALGFRAGQQCEREANAAVTFSPLTVDDVNAIYIAWADKTKGVATALAQINAILSNVSRQSPAPEPAVAGAFRDLTVNEAGRLSDRISLACDGVEIARATNAFLRELFAAPATPAPVAAAPRAAANVVPESFRQYVAVNMPADTIISDPDWWAPQLWRAAAYAINSTAPEPAVAQAGWSDDALIAIYHAVREIINSRKDTVTTATLFRTSTARQMREVLQNANCAPATPAPSSPSWSDAECNAIAAAAHNTDAHMFVAHAHTIESVRKALTKLTNCARPARVELSEAELKAALTSALQTLNHFSAFNVFGMLPNATQKRVLDEMDKIRAALHGPLAAGGAK